MGCLAAVRRRLDLVRIVVVALLAAGMPLIAGAQPQAATGTLVVQAIDDNGNAVIGICVKLTTPDKAFVALGCDVTDGVMDGVATIPDLPVGRYVVTPYSWARDDLARGSVSVVVLSGETTKTTIQMAANGDSIAIATVDNQGDALWGACYAVLDLSQEDPASHQVASGCDRYDGYNDGNTTIGGLKNGRYLLVQSVPPPGYVIAPPQTFTIEGNQDGSLTVTNAPGGVAAVVTNVDPAGGPVRGACYAVFADAGNGQRGALVTRVCDFSPAGSDQALITGLAPGRYLLAEIEPVPGYQRLADHPFVIRGKEGVTLSLQSLPVGEQADATPAPATFPPATPTPRPVPPPAPPRPGHNNT